ncbi:tripartite tricarboxylate transporter permease [Metabacillus arenae]|uniref:Tripartite tricarboxylate transporter permease n=1 Tax=Metabacillus arenae TaxID=2771434 RepID=A0A926NPY8_9BACI|nr:tripartite tricarboxylate transporter permease [Metabacillus arenae]MBD1381786.1 tripartite tricarboxylate transporter permease [Metabacillus arenae]
MELQFLMEGFVSLLNPQVIMWCLVGVTLGTLVGALPGLGPTAGVALLLPLCFSLDTLEALVLLMGIYQGTMYGGRMSSILVNVPGEASAVVTAFDGYPMTKKGKAGYALALSAIASFIGGMIGFMGLVFLTPLVADWALIFSSPEYFALILFALLATSGLGDQSLLKGLIAMGLGLLLSMVGMDAIQGSQRLTFGLLGLWDGIELVVVAVGIFGISEVLVNIESKGKRSGDGDSSDIARKIPFKELFPTIKQIISNGWSIVRGALTGFFVGTLPGAGATVATFLSYSTEKKLSKTPEQFGKGKDQGLSGPESANNASIGGALIPLFSMGIPGSGTGAILLGALIMLGLQPGPLMIEKSGDIIWATIAGLMLANVLLLILNTAFVPGFAWLIEVVKPYLAPLIAALCFIGVYMINYSYFEVGLMLLLGVLGYFLKKFHFPLAPIVLALVLGGMLETNYRQSLLLSHNDFSIFFTRPIALVFMLLTIFVLIFPIIKKVFKIEKKQNDLTY